MERFAVRRPPWWLVTLLMASMLVLGSGVGYVRGAETPAGNCPASKDTCQKFNDFWKVWDIAEKRFVDPKAIKPDKMIAGAINGMLDSFGDQGHTRYLTAEENKSFAEQLRASFEGIGAYMDMSGPLPAVMAPLEGSPAEKAGILPGDVILRINGQSTEGLTEEEVISRIKGPKGTQVKLEVRHPGQETSVEITITRDRVTFPNVTWRMLPGNIAHIRLSQFSENVDAAVRKAVDDARVQGAAGLIFDVRDNPGGLRDQAISVSGLFVPNNSVILNEVMRDGSKKEFRSEEKNPVLDLPMVVLVNNGSASSAEILAGALQDYGRAKLVGVPTNGTGTVLSTISLDNGTALLLGTAQWQTPKGRYLRRQGVTPDFTVGLPIGVRALTPTTEKQLSAAQLLATQDTQIKKALELLGKK